MLIKLGPEWLELGGGKAETLDLEGTPVAIYCLVQRQLFRFFCQFLPNSVDCVHWALNQAAALKSNRNTVHIFYAAGAINMTILI